MHRVELFNQFPHRVTLADDVSVMNRAATEDVRAPVWPVVSQVLHTGPAPNALDAQVVDVLDDWVRRDAPALDADNDGLYDDAGPAIMDALWKPDRRRGDAAGVRRPHRRPRPASAGSAALSGESYVDKDLRTLLHEHVHGRFNLRYCGNGSLDRLPRLAVGGRRTRSPAASPRRRGPNPAVWTSTASRTGFTPGLIPDTFPSTNRPTFQQVLELARPRD